MSIVISCFEIPRDAEVPVEPAPGRQVHRAIAADARFGYIAVDTGTGTGTEPIRSAVPALTGRYKLIHTGDTAAPPFGGAVGEDSVIFINCMEFPIGRERESFEFWERVNKYMVRKPGYRWHKLHARMDPATPFGQINVVEWESVAAWEAAHDDGFRALAVRPDIPFVPVATLCRPVSVPVGA